MRKLLLILFALCSIAAVAQEREYRPFCEEGKEWVVRYTTTASDKEVEIIYRLEGVQDINGHLCMIMTEEAAALGIPKRATVAVYEEDKKVYFYELDDSTGDFSLLYDFNMKVGDRTRVLGGEIEWTEVECIALSEQKFVDVMRHVIKVNFVTSGSWEMTIAEDPSFLDETEKWIGPQPLWIEGIGSVEGPLFPVIPDPIAIGRPHYRLALCKVDNDILYDPQGLAAAHFTTIPTTSVSPTYDLSGRKTFTPHARGIYIEGGKKVVR